MRSPKHFFAPLAIGAPAPLREVPFKPSRMIHFFDPSNAKMAVKVPDIAKQTDVLLGNLEDAVASDKKLAAREGFIEIAKATDLAAPDLILTGQLRRFDLVRDADPWMAGLAIEPSG